MKKVILLFIFLSTIVLSEDSITIAPAPVGSDNISGSGEENRVSLNYFNFSADSLDLTGIGIGYGLRKRDGNGNVTDGSISYTFLSGEQEDGTLTQDIEGFTINANYLWGKVLDNKDSIAYVGPSFIYYYNEATVPYGTPTGAIGDSYSYMTLYGVQAGIQHYMDTSFGQFIPWFFLTYMGGTLELEKFNTTNDNTSDIDIDFDLAYQFGFDMYFKDLGATLSALYKSNDAGDIINLSYIHKF